MVWFAYRVYAVTGRNKLIGIVLALTIAAQFCQGTFAIIWIALHSRKAYNHLIVRVRTHWFLVEPLPEINLDPFKICLYERWRLGELMYYNLSTFFGTPSPSTCGIISPGGLGAPHIPLPFPPMLCYRRSSCILDHSSRS